MFIQGSSWARSPLLETLCKFLVEFSCEAVWTWAFVCSPLAPQLEKTHETPPSSREEGHL